SRAAARVSRHGRRAARRARGRERRGAGHAARAADGAADTAGRLRPRKVRCLERNGSVSITTGPKGEPMHPIAGRLWTFVAVTLLLGVASPSRAADPGLTCEKGAG